MSALTLNDSAIPAPELEQLRGAGVHGIRLDAHRAAASFELCRTDHGREQSTTLVLAGVQYSRFEFDEVEEHEVVELVSIEAEHCVLGLRLFGELSNGTFEFVCSSVRTEPETR